MGEIEQCETNAQFQESRQNLKVVCL